MKKIVTLVMAVENEDDSGMSDEFIEADLRAEIWCACNWYEIIEFSTRVVEEGE